MITYNLIKMNHFLRLRGMKLIKQFISLMINNQYRFVLDANKYVFIGTDTVVLNRIIFKIMKNYSFNV